MVGHFKEFTKDIHLDGIAVSSIPSLQVVNRRSPPYTVFPYYEADDTVS